MTILVFDASFRVAGSIVVSAGSTDFKAVSAPMSLHDEVRAALARLHPEVLRVEDIDGVRVASAADAEPGAANYGAAVAAALQQEGVSAAVVDDSLLGYFDAISGLRIADDARAGLVRDAVSLRGADAVAYLHSVEEVLTGLRKQSKP